MTEEAQEQFSMLDPQTQTAADREFVKDMNAYWDMSLGTNIDRLRNFPKFVPRQSLSLFLAKHELYKRLITVHGHIIECGVFLGGGLMTWAQLSAIYEPVNHTRRIVGFDTFTGFVDLAPQDSAKSLSYAEPGGLTTGARSDIEESVRLYDLNRPLGHIQRVELVEGDAAKTIPAYVASNPHLVVAMLYLDFDLYEPTKIAIETLLPRMPKGAILAFDELSQAAWPGETMAVLESVGLRNLRIERSPLTPALSYALLE